MLFTIISFSFLTSIVYLINDLFDQELDRLHPVKKYRPIASKEISYVGISLCFFFLITTIFILFLIIESLQALSFLYLIYFLNNIFYNLFIKKSNIYFASLSVSIGFILRLFIGGAILNISVSTELFSFILLSTYVISFYKKISDLNEENLLKRSKLRQFSALIYFLILCIYVYHIQIYNLLNLNILFISNIILFIYCGFLTYAFLVKKKDPEIQLICLE